LLFVLFLQAGGLLLVYKVRQHYVKFRMARVIENEQSLTEQLTISIEDFKESRINKKEILFRGNMYDIKSCVFSGDSVILVVINDTREKKIMEKIKFLAGQKSHQNRDIPHKIIKLCTLDYIVPVGQDNSICFFISEEKYKVYTEDQLTLKQDILSPPPELV